MWGLRLVLLADRQGVPVGDDLLGPKSGEERETALQLATAHSGGLLFAGGGSGTAARQLARALAAYDGR